MRIISGINIAVLALFILLYAYQGYFILVSWFKKRRALPKAPSDNHFAIIVCARNEANVIPDLVNCIKRQTYPQDKLHMFLVADNCTDDTAEVGRRAGMTVYERNDLEKVGKSYALELLFEKLKTDFPDGFDGYFVFDADNIINDDYIEKINDVFSAGYEVVTGYRNSKNYGSSWVSAAHALWFLRESRYLNESRYLMNLSCAISGTGFVISRRIIEENGGWPFHLMTEDVEFTATRIIKGEKFGYCAEAELYDEQPIKFSQSWNQRLRWSKGNFQVFAKYGKAFVKGFFKGNFSCYDMAMATVPAFVLSFISLLCMVIGWVGMYITGDSVKDTIIYIITTFSTMYFAMFLIGFIATITEWKHINAGRVKRILYLFTFPLFMLSYIIIAVGALFCKVSWKPIEHTVTESDMHKK